MEMGDARKREEGQGAGAAKEEGMSAGGAGGEDGGGPAGDEEPGRYGKFLQVTERRKIAEGANIFRFFLQRHICQ
jgi:hypothetical protein